METLPTRRQAYIGAATAKVLKTHFFCFIFLLKVLSHYSEDEVYLPETPSWLFGEERVRGIFHIFFITNSPNSLWGIIHSIINLFFLGEGHL